MILNLKKLLRHISFIEKIEIGTKKMIFGCFNSNTEVSSTQNTKHKATQNIQSNLILKEKKQSH